MNTASEFLQWLSPFSWLLRNEDLQGLLRLIAGSSTLLFSSIAFYIKLREKREQRGAQLAVSDTSWDAKTRLPLNPIQTISKSLQFPFVAADLSTRIKGPKGWFTVTELRVWNAGEAPLWGRAFNPTVTVEVAIEGGVGSYELRGCLTNDASARVHLGRVIHGATGQQRLPIHFDILRPGKGVLVQIWHNSEDGSKLRINAIADRSSRTLVGVHHPINPSIFNLINTATRWFVLPAAVVTVLFLISHSIAAAYVSGFLTWALIFSTYLSWKLKPLAPRDLSYRNNAAKVLFYYGPG